MRTAPPLPLLLSKLTQPPRNCNATGVYGGVVESGNGNTNDLSNINATFLRGVQQADGDGVVQFKSIFPGHYSGRATHHHMIVYQNASILPNGTLDAGSYAHVGQLFWDQDLITKVEATYPYNTNTIEITENAVDHVFSGEVETSDPIFEYVYLGDTLADGLFGWITVVVNTSASYDPSYSFAYTAEGGVEELGGSDAVTTMGGGNGTNGTGPEGAAPSGVAKLI